MGSSNPTPLIGRGILFWRCFFLSLFSRNFGAVCAACAVCAVATVAGFSSFSSCTGDLAKFVLKLGPWQPNLPPFGRCGIPWNSRFRCFFGMSSRWKLLASELRNHPCRGRFELWIFPFDIFPFLIFLEFFSSPGWSLLKLAEAGYRQSARTPEPPWANWPQEEAGRVWFVFVVCGLGSKLYVFLGVSRCFYWYSMHLPCMFYASCMHVRCCYRRVLRAESIEFTRRKLHIGEWSASEDGEE